MTHLYVMPYTFVDKYQSFGGIRCFLIQRRRIVYCVTIRVTLLDIQPEHAIIPKYNYSWFYLHELTKYFSQNVAWRYVINTPSTPNRSFFRALQAPVATEHRI
jgi:hypothetical protein